VKISDKQRERFFADLDKLSLAQIENRLANGGYRGKQITLAEEYVEKKKLAMHRRFERKGWGLALTAGGLLATFLMWLFR
jgi:hypothetical protein